MPLRSSVRAASVLSKSWSRNIMTTSIAQIPTITEMYANRQLDSSSKPVFKPVAIINDRVSIWRGDITILQVDGVQNAANDRLRGGGGIDGAIHDAAGDGLYDACRKLNGCETGQTKITPGFNLPAKYILHTVGPIYRRYKPDKAAELLTSCYRTTLQVAIDNDIKSIALCGVSTGVYGYPLDAATHIALNTTREVLQDNPDKLDRVIFCCFGENAEREYLDLAPIYFPPRVEAEERT